MWFAIVVLSLIVLWLLVSNSLLARLLKSEMEYSKAVYNYAKSLDNSIYTLEKIVKIHTEQIEKR